MTKKTTTLANHNNIRTGIVELLKAARSAAARNVNSIMTAVYSDRDPFSRYGFVGLLPGAAARAIHRVSVGGQQRPAVPIPTLGSVEAGSEDATTTPFYVF